MSTTRLRIAAGVFVLVSLLAAGGVLSHGLTAPSQKAKGDEKQADVRPVAVKVVKPKKGGSPLMVTQPADIVAAQQQQVGPLIAGTVKEVLVDIGDRVKKGQTLIVLDAPLLAREVKEAEASLELAQAQVEEVKANGGTPTRAQASLKAAQARVRLAQATLDRVRMRESLTQLKAAFDGVVTRRTIDPGNFVQPSDSRLLRPLLTVQGVDMLRIVVTVSERHAPLIKRGMPVEVEIPDVHQGTYKISRFGAALEGDKREMTVEIDVPNKDGRLLPGMTGEVRLPLRKTSPDSWIVARSCVVNSGFPHGPAVYVVRDGKAKVRQVRIGSQDSQNVEIREGIQASDLLITSNQSFLKDGSPITVEKEP